MRYLLILAVFMITSPVWAEDETYSKCMDKASTNYDIRQCNAARLEIIDAELNQVWRALYPSLPPGRAKTALLNEQRKWIAFKDGACLFWHHGFGTAGRDMYLYSCAENLIKKRIEYLSELNSNIIEEANLIKDIELDIGISREPKIFSNAPIIECTYRSDPNLLPSDATRDKIVCGEVSIDLKKNDAELNQVWREIRAEWNNEDFQRTWEAILQEQRKWVAFKESACQYYLEESFVIGCLSELTEQRTRELREVLKNPEEDED